MGSWESLLAIGQTLALFSIREVRRCPGKKLCGQDSAQNPGDFSHWENFSISITCPRQARHPLVWCPQRRGLVLSGRPFLTKDNCVPELPPWGVRAGALRQGSVCVPAFLVPQVDVRKGVHPRKPHPRALRKTLRGEWGAGLPLQHLSPVSAGVSGNFSLYLWYFFSLFK